MHPLAGPTMGHGQDIVDGFATVSSPLLDFVGHRVLPFVPDFSADP